MHLKVDNIEKAKNIIKISRDSGFKMSGLISIENLIVEIRGAERLETVLFDNDKEYIKLLVNETNKKLERNRKRIENFYLLLTSNIGSSCLKQ